MTSKPQGVGRITDVFLRAKHWQIFALMCVTYVAAGVVLVGLEIKFQEAGTRAASPSLALMLLTEAVWVPFLLSWLGWLATVGFFLNSNLAPEQKLRTGLFRFALVYTVGFLFVGPPLFVEANPPDWIVLPLFLFAIVCLFYLLIFVAKALKTTDLQRPMIMNEYTIELFLLFFLPLGIWLIQPKINRLYAEAQKAAKNPRN